MKRHTIHLHGRGHASLETMGFAVAHFSHYVHTATSATHGHDILEANFIVRGTARHIIGDTERRCPPGSLGIVHYGQAHSLTTDAEGVELFNIYLDPARHASPILPEPFATAAASLFPSAPHPGIPRGLTSFLQFGDPAPLTHLLSYCLTEQERAASGYEQILESAWRALLISCARQAMADGVETLVADHSRWAPLESVRLLLERHYERAHRLADLATHASMSEAHLCRQFKAYTGLAPFAYLAQRRIDIARQHLRSSNAKVLDIALACGFNDIGHFNRKFRQLTGCTPSRYRATR
ncbi:MAG: AraC family transcriptional regulator [Verrucomicrobia bacterium]|jgi:AraC-like DNA-binding protein|nr:AraC family transcriptional regulator [Verrucomicrobiota bacterium]MBT7065337.1 AraC family transcriptional regulator [Verrucomicrobiota bacterium]MBT7700406.1 AraC family transcriptional regulator [Verrucomicrobiota bacterium]